MRQNLQLHSNLETGTNALVARSHLRVKHLHSSHHRSMAKIQMVKCLAVMVTLFPILACASQPRLREKSFDLLGVGARSNDSYSPRHLSGYFSLNRTYAAEMFYFFFEHRSSADGPLILWMTGENLA